jgi:Zn-dependent protease/CBS domain-containing protein
MKWSWKIGSVAGIVLSLHATFLILIVWIGTAAWLRGGTAADVTLDVAFVLALFACVVLHELGHALAARRFGIRTRDITLLPIGGLARLERIPDEPRQELFVALAGPAVNALIAVALWMLLAALGEAPLSRAPDLLQGPFAARLLAVNVFIMGFNLLPAFPMDGGRALRALLATRMDYVAATQLAANIGQAMALAFGLIGLLINPFLVFIALFVWTGAGAEAGLAQTRAALAGLPVSRAMLTDFATLRSDDPLERAIELTLAGSQKDFSVLDGGRLRGILTQARLLHALERGDRSAAVGGICASAVETADSHEMLEAVLARQDRERHGSLPVTHDDRLVGLLTLDNVGEWLRIQAALGERPQRVH